ncbi:GL18765 [Drosophila persimilis]|uniref:GL18765 n=1 Tax=Drosophila persimilis TaxID=7234 RepID=B4G8U2_DROPE|nr:GL18765 [Drosophila persimilis]
MTALKGFIPASSNANSNRKRAFSNPHIGGPHDAAASGHRLNPHLYYYNKSYSGRSSFCVDESLWPTNAARVTSDTNLYTMPNNASASAADEDYEEAIDQFSPTIYSQRASRSIPIPNSAGNSPQHHQPRIGSSGVNYMAAFSASPLIYAHPYSPFYASSPDTTLSSPVHTPGHPGLHPAAATVAAASAHPSRRSLSYDPAFQRLQVPHAERRSRSPLECATVFAAVAAAATASASVSGSILGDTTKSTGVNRYVKLILQSPCGTEG